MKRCILLTLSLLALVSCGAKNSSTTLKVTSNFAATNDLFPGGVVVTGKSDTGDSFTIPVSYVAGSGSSVDLTLKRGTWTFTAIGWDGTSLGLGTSRCDYQTVSLSSDAQTVTLSLGATKCPTLANAAGVSSFMLSNDFKPLFLTTCGSFYLNNGTEITSTTSTTYCNSSNVPSAYVKYATSAWVEVPNLMNGTQTKGLGTCLTIGANGSVSAGMKIPPHLPLMITLYDAANCTTTTNNDLIATYDFLGGINTTYSDKDHFLANATGSMNLFLPSNKIRRARNSFYSLMPKIQCGSTPGPCVTAPTTLNITADRVIASGQDFVLADGIDPTIQNCSTVAVTTTVPSALTFNASNDCYVEDKQIIIRLNFTTPMTAAATVSYNFSGGTSTSITVAPANTTTPDLYRNYSFAFENLGFSDGAIPSIALSFRSFFQDDKEDNKGLGLISRASEFFAPNGPLAVFGALPCGAGYNKEAYVSFYEDGTFKTYRGVISDTSASTPTYICNDTDPTGATCTNYFNKRVVIQKKQPTSQIFDTEMTLLFSCATKTGMIERQDLSNSGTKSEKEILYWNTQDSNYARLEHYSSEKEYLSGSLTRSSTDVTRIEKVGVDDVKVASMRYNYDKNSSSIANAHVNVSQLHRQVASQMFLSKDIAVPNTLNPEEIFGGVNEALFTRNFGRFFYAESPDRNYYMKAAFMGSCPSTLSLVGTVVNRTTGVQTPLSLSSSNFTSCSSSPMLTMSLSINNAGRGIMALGVGPKVMVQLFDSSTNSWLSKGIMNSTFNLESGLLRSHVFPGSTGKAVIYWSQSESGFSTIRRLTWSNFVSDMPTDSTSTVVYTSTGSTLISRFLRLAPTSDGQVIYVLNTVDDGTMANQVAVYHAVSNALETPSPTSVAVNTNLIQDVRPSVSTNTVKFYLQLTSSTASALVFSYDPSTMTPSLSPTTISVSSGVGSFFQEETCATTGTFTLLNGCSAINGESFLAPIKSGISLNPKVLAPSTFDSIFTPESTFKAQ